MAASVSKDLAKYSFGIRDLRASDHWREAPADFSLLDNYKTIVIFPGSGSTEAKDANGMCKIFENMLPEELKSKVKICSLYYERQPNQYDSSVMRAQSFFDNYMVPLFATRDENGDLHRMSAVKAAHNARKLIIGTHCYGSSILNGINRLTDELMTDLGYLAEERRFIQKQIFVVQHNNIEKDLDSHKFNFTNLIRLSAVDERLDLRATYDGTFRHYVTTTDLSDKDALFFNMAENADVLLVHRTVMAGRNGHNGGFWSHQFKLDGALKEEEVFKLIFDEVASSDYIIENTHQILDKALVKHPEKQELAAKVSAAGDAYINNCRNYINDIKTNFSECCRQIETGTLDAAKVPQNVLFAVDKYNNFLLDYAFAENNEQMVKSIFTAMQQSMPERKIDDPESAEKWEKWPRNKNQIEAINRTETEWSTKALAIKSPELFAMFSDKSINLQNVNYAKADDNMLLAAAEVFSERKFLPALPSMNNFAQAFAKLYAQTEKRASSDALQQAQQLLESKIFGSENDPKSYFTDRVYSYAEKFGARKLQTLINQHQSVGLVQALKNNHSR
jgi:hypothetical protein